MDHTYTPINWQVEHVCSRVHAQHGYLKVSTEFYQWSLDWFTGSTWTCTCRPKQRVLQMIISSVDRLRMDTHTHMRTQSSINDHFINLKAQNGHMHAHTHTPRVPPKISSSVNRLRMDTLISNTVSQWSVYQLIGWEWTHSCTHTYMPQQSSPNDQFINWQAENRHTHAHIFTPSRVVSMISVSTDGLRMDTHTQTFTPKQSAPND